jgi:hypothetical protein
VSGPGPDEALAEVAATETATTPTASPAQTRKLRDRIMMNLPFYVVSPDAS